MSPRELVTVWVDAFNRQDVDALASMYTADAVNHQVAESPVQGRDSIRAMFVNGFASAKMVCIVENIFEEGSWAILEWRDPLGLRGCGFFRFEGELIALPTRLLGQAHLPSPARSSIANELMFDSTRGAA